MNANEIMDALKEYWYMILAGVSFVYGYARLASRAENNEKSIVELETRINKQRQEDLQRSESMLKEIRSDVKQLLSRGSK